MNNSRLLCAGLVVLSGFLPMGGTQAHPAHAQPVDYPFVVGFERFYASDDNEEYLTQGGLLLLNELNCVACHTPPEPLKDRLQGRPGTNLQGVGTRLKPVDIEMMIRNARFVKRGTIMPSFFAGPDRDVEEILALKHYLASLTDKPEPMPEGDVKNGQRLFHRIGCVACHEPETGFVPDHLPPDTELELVGLPSVPLNLADRYDYHALGRFLLNPAELRPSGRMPDMKLSEAEAADLAAYLKSAPKLEIPDELKDQLAPEGDSFHLDPALVDKGRELFAKKNCVACHSQPEGQAAAPQPAQPLAKLAWQERKGCLSESAPGGPVPYFYLDEVQKKAIQLALKHLREEKPLTAEHRIDLTMTSFNCYACHTREGRGGPELAREPYFASNSEGAESLGQLGNLPPDLRNVGRKLTPMWLEKILFGEGGEVRPYIAARMPRFQREDIGHLLKDLPAVDKTEKPVEIDVTGLPRYQRGHYGRDLMGVSGLSCVTCHGLKGEKSLGPPVVDLTHTVDRLQPEYFKELLLYPQEVQPGTLMPPLFTGRKKANEEIEQIWTYLKELDQRRLPDGLLKSEAFELMPEKEGKPIVFRTFLEGVGTQSVSVGFPEKLNASFDSYEIRWGLAWRGRFLDAMSTWDDRYCTPAKPLGEGIRSFPAAMPLAILKSGSEPWPDSYGPEAGYEFHGFRLDEKGVPAFLYEWKGLKVEDRVAPAGEAKLRRTVTLTGKAENVYFKGLAEDAKPQPVDLSKGQAVIQEEITW